MQSQINYNAITTTYPVAGVDNDSQGFRDNFSAILAGLAEASTEITYLLQNTAQTNTTTNFNGNLVTGATLVGNPELATTFNQNPGLIGSPTTSTVNIIYGQADYFQAQISTNTTFVTYNWPVQGLLGKITLEIQPDTSTFATGTTIQFSTDGVNPAPNIHADANTPFSTTYGFTMTSTSSYIWDIWTINSGQDLYIKLKGVWPTYLAGIQ
jgi:hypothetical protein